MQTRSNVHVLNRANDYTSADQVVKHLSVRVISDWRTYKQIAEGVECAPSTIANIATGKTKWPSPRIFFGLLKLYKIRMRLE